MKKIYIRILIAFIGLLLIGIATIWTWGWAIKHKREKLINRIQSECLVDDILARKKILISEYSPQDGKKVLDIMDKLKANRSQLNPQDVAIIQKAYQNYLYNGLSCDKHTRQNKVHNLLDTCKAVLTQYD